MSSLSCITIIHAHILFFLSMHIPLSFAEDILKPISIYGAQSWQAQSEPNLAWLLTIVTLYTHLLERQAIHPGKWGTAPPWLLGSPLARNGQKHQYYTGIQAFFLPFFLPQTSLHSSNVCLLFIQHREKLAFISASILPNSFYIIYAHISLKKRKHLSQKVIP